MGRWVSDRSPSGHVVKRWVADVPRLPSDFVDCVVYLYRTEDAATCGDATGGCGFLVGVESSITPGLAHVYVVTNAHVADGCRVVRYNSVEGPRNVDLSSGDWYQRGDLAVCSMDLLWFYDERVSVIRGESLLSREKAEQIPLRHGDDLFMLSRFAGHPGDQDNEPVARFGTLAKPRPVMIDHDPLLSTPAGFPQESFLVEMRSLPGHSGSPVFVYFSALSPRFGADKELPEVATYILGIDWGHPPSLRPVLGADKKTPIPGRWVADNSGMACVVPAWQISELLESEGAVAARRQREEEIKAQLEAETPAVVLDSLTEGAPSVDRTGDLLGRLLAVPKDEARGDA